MAGVMDSSRNQQISCTYNTEINSHQVHAACFGSLTGRKLITRSTRTSPELRPSELKTGTPVSLLLPWGTFAPILVDGRLFIFELKARTVRTDRQTDGRQDQGNGREARFQRCHDNAGIQRQQVNECRGQRRIKEQTSTSCSSALLAGGDDDSLA